MLGEWGACVGEEGSRAVPVKCIVGQDGLLVGRLRRSNPLREISQSVLCRGERSLKLVRILRVCTDCACCT